MGNFVNPGFETNLTSWNAGKKPSAVDTDWAWHDANQIVGLVNNDPVGQWNDESGNAYHVTQATAGKKPIYKTNQINSLPVVEFTEASAHTLSETGGAAITGNFTVIILGKVGANTATYRTFFTSGNNGSTGNFLFSVNPDETLQLNPSGGGGVSTANAAAVGSPEIWMVYYNGTTGYISRNANAEASGALSFTTPDAGHMLSTYEGLTQAFGGQLGEVIVYASNLSAQNKSYLFAYLALKWGISTLGSNFGANITRDTATKYAGAASAKIVSASASALTPFFEEINPGTTDYYLITAYAYTTGAAVTAADVEIYYDGAAVTTTFTDMGSGWYKITATVIGANASKKIGVEVKTNKTVYVDGFDLSVTTPPVTLTVPNMLAYRARNISRSRARIEGRIDGSISQVTEMGFRYGTSSVISATDPSVTITPATGEITVQLSRLYVETQYWGQLYVVIEGVTYNGNVIRFKTAARKVLKSYFYKVYSKAGVYLTTWTRDVISEPQFRTNINNGPGQMLIKLGRKYDEFSEGTEVELQNKVEVYVVDEENHDGMLLYSGYISAYQPKVDEVKEWVEITLLSYAAELSRIILRDSSGNTTVAYSGVSPEYMLRDVIDKYRRLGGTINYSSTSVNITNVTVTYTFNTNTIKECLDAILSFCPSGWYYYIDPTNVIYLQPKNVLSDHDFMLGKHVESLDTFRRIEDLVNRVLITGGGDPPLYTQHNNVASQTEFGVYEKKIVDKRLTDTVTAGAIANQILGTYGSAEIRSTYKILDNNGQTDKLIISSPGLLYDPMGYDIESIRPGHTLRILNLKLGTRTFTLWDEFTWDVDVWDQTIESSAADVLQIVSIQYFPDYMVLEASSRPPFIPRRIEDVNTNVQQAATVNNPAAPS